MMALMIQPFRIESITFIIEGRKKMEDGTCMKGSRTARILAEEALGALKSLFNVDLPVEGRIGREGWHPHT